MPQPLSSRTGRREPDGEQRLLDACRVSRTKHLAAVVTVALESGLRKSELTLRYAHLAPEHLRGEIVKTERPADRAQTAAPIAHGITHEIVASEVVSSN